MRIRMKLLAIVAVLGLTGLGLGSTAAHPAMAHNLFAHAAVDCYGYCLELSANNLNAGDADRITITFTLISITGTTTVTREIDFIPSGPTWTYVNCFDWPGAPLNPSVDDHPPTVLITGVAEGIGRALAIRFAASRLYAAMSENSRRRSASGACS